VSDLLFASEESGVTHLRHEGVPEERIHLVGNCMVDSLVKHRDAAVSRAPWKEFGLEPGSYALLTLHRPSNVDEDAALRALMVTINRVAERLPVLFPVHPRTRDRLAKGGIATLPGLRLTDPLPYLTFLGLMARAKCVLTDSGGIQEETTALGVPCLTLRENTERPATITCGTNRLVGNDPAQIEAGVVEILAGRWPTGSRPQFWDGQAAVRVVDVIQAWAAKRPVPLS
jgi:UDP-N-acetylglucosamine 2-epimerase (non-hydrolysing)